MVLFVVTVTLLISEEPVVDQSVDSLIQKCLAESRRDMMLLSHPDVALLVCSTYCLVWT